MTQLRDNLETCVPISDFYAFEIVKQKDHVALQHPNGSIVGILSAQTAKALESVITEASVELEAFLRVSDCQNVIQRARKPGQATLDADVNVYGHSPSRKAVKSKLSSAKLYLQHTRHRRDEYMSDNPHFVEFPGIKPTIGEKGPTEYSELDPTVKAQPFKQILHEVWESTRRGDHLTGLKSDIRVKTPLLS